MKYKVREVELLAKKDGGEYKKLVLKADDSPNEEPRVTLWDNHPEYENAIVGAYISGFLEKKQSDTPIPAHPGKFYINRTLLAEGTEVGASEQGMPPIIVALTTRLADLETWAVSQGYELKTLSEPVSGDTKEGESVSPDDIPF